MTLKLPTQKILPAEVNSPRVTFDWYLWPKDSFIHGPDYQASASILIFHQGMTVGEFDNKPPPFHVQLENGEGEYIIDVRPQKKLSLSEWLLHTIHHLLIPNRLRIRALSPQKLDKDYDKKDIHLISWLARLIQPTQKAARLISSV